jgi:hypothetical protein
VIPLIVFAGALTLAILIQGVNPCMKKIIHRKKSKVQLELIRTTRELVAIKRQMTTAADQRFPNPASQKGWQDALRFLNVPIREAAGSRSQALPATQARQSSITHRTDRPEPMETPAE